MKIYAFYRTRSLNVIHESGNPKHLLRTNISPEKEQIQRYIGGFLRYSRPRPLWIYSKRLYTIQRTVHRNASSPHGCSENEMFGKVDTKQLVFSVWKRTSTSFVGSQKTPCRPPFSRAFHVCGTKNILKAQIRERRGSHCMTEVSRKCF